MLPHSWDLTPKQAIALQKGLAGQVRIEPLAGPIRTVAGADCAFIGRGKGTTEALAVAVLCDARTMEVLETSEVVLPCAFPYVPGLLSFREAPAVIEAVRKLSRRPDLLMIDGQGLAHPRFFGIACHVGVWLDIPTIGAAKSLLCGEHRMPAQSRGRWTRIRYKDCVVGAAVHTQDGVKPMYVSVGNRITLGQAVRWTVRCATQARLPEPTRRAHMYVTRMKCL